MAPLLSGTGIKIKVLEAMGSGIPIVANSIAMQGIPAQADRDYLHAESHGEFAHQVVRLLQDQVLAAEISKNGQQLIDAAFDLSRGPAQQRNFFHQVAGRTDRCASEPCVGEYVT